MGDEIFTCVWSPAGGLMIQNSIMRRQSFLETEQSVAVRWDSDTRPRSQELEGASVISFWLSCEPGYRLTSLMDSSSSINLTSIAAWAVVAYAALPLGGGRGWKRPRSGRIAALGLVFRNSDSGKICEGVSIPIGVRW